jgi:hypothetical protein
MKDGRGEFGSVRNWENQLSQVMLMKNLGEEYENEIKINFEV